MAWTYNIENAFGTVTLNSGGAQVIDYAARSAPVMDGNETVDEPFRILITGTSRADVDAIVGTIQRKFREGERWQQSKNGARTFFTRSLADDTTTKRSEFVSADFSVSSPEYVGTAVYGGHFGAYRTELSGVITRRNWWEGAEAQISLTNTNGTNNTTGLRTFSVNDQTGSAGTVRVNWVDIDATKIAGDLPAATRLELHWEVANWTNPVFVVARTPTAHGTATSFWSETIYGFTANAGTVTAYTNSDYQSYPGGTLSSFNATGTVGLQTYLGYFNSAGYYHTFARMWANSGTTIKVTPFFNSIAVGPTGSNGDFTYGQGQYITVQTYDTTFDLGLIKFPASYHADESQRGFAGIKLEGLGSGTINIDYLSFVRDDMSRKLIGTTDAVSTIDDGLDDLSAYGVIVAGVAQKDYSTIGQSIKLIPGLYHRIHFYALSINDNPSPTQLIKLYYRPRYLSL